MTTLLTASPKCVKKREAFLAQYSEDELKLMLDMANDADPISDSVISEQMSSEKGSRSDIRTGVKEGLASLSDPAPALKAFLEDSEQLPDWVNQDTLVKGAENYLTVNALWQSVSLGPGSLTHTYCSPTIAKVLTQTTNITDMAVRRILETALWKQYVLVPNGLKPGNKGYIHTLEVRLLHSRVRVGLLKKGWDTDTLGQPINQLDMMRTWLDFTYIPFMALEKFGITYSDEELSDVYHLWQLIAKLLGIPEKYFRLVQDKASAQKMLAMLDLVSNEPNEDSKLLTEKMLLALGHILSPFIGLPPEVTIDLMHSFCRVIHGDELADQLGVTQNATMAMIPVFTAANAYEKQFLDNSAEYRQQKIQETLATFDMIADDIEAGGQTTYQQNADVMGEADIPQTA